MNSASWRWTSAVDPVVAQEARALLALASRFDAAAARADAGRFGLVFGRVGILPPDQYLSLVVQATEGCSFNTCTFCDLYHEGYRVKTPEEFRQHVERRARATSARRRRCGRAGIFLGAANALAVPMARLLPIFETLLEELDAARRGVCAFVDGFTGARKTVGRVPAAEPPRPAPRVRRASSPATTRCWRSCASPGPPPTPSRRSGPSRRRACRSA